MPSETMNYYNEIGKAAAEWLRQLIALGLIPEHKGCPAKRP